MGSLVGGSATIPLEECYFTPFFNPIPDNEGHVGGVFAKAYRIGPSVESKVGSSGVTPSSA
jgi:hypothetical protein